MSVPLSHLVDIIASLYGPTPTGFDLVQTTGGINWAIRYEGDVDIVVCRGSADLRDWWRDGLSEISRVIPGYPSVGHLPFGFGEGLLAAYRAITGRLRARTGAYWLGHSLGAAHVSELAGMAVADGRFAQALVLCGCPRPGMIPLVTLLNEKAGRIVSLRNGQDPVPTVPFALPPLLEWRDLVPFTLLNEPPDPGTETVLGAIAPEVEWHHVSLYQRGAKKIDQPV